MSNDDEGKIRIVPAAEGQARYEELLRQAPPGTVGIDGSVVNDLALAINCYVSTGDDVGEVSAFDMGDSYLIMILHNPKDAVDAANFDKFKRRVAGIDGIEFNKMPGKDPPPFVTHELHVPKNQVASLATELVRSCGNSDWEVVMKQSVEPLRSI